MPKAVGRRSLNVSRGRNSICSTSVAEKRKGKKGGRQRGQSANAKKVQMSKEQGAPNKDPNKAKQNRRKSLPQES